MKCTELYSLNERLNHDLTMKVVKAVTAVDGIPAAYWALSEAERFVMVSFTAAIYGPDCEDDLDDLTIGNITDIYKEK